MADKAIYSVDTVTSMSGTDKVYVNTGNNIKQITKDNLCGNAIREINDNLSSEISRAKEADEILKSRVDVITSLPEGSTTGDAELQDIRVKADGTTATSAGNAVREQFNELKSDLIDTNTSLLNSSLSINYLLESESIEGSVWTNPDGGTYSVEGYKRWAEFTVPAGIYEYTNLHDDFSYYKNSNGTGALKNSPLVVDVDTKIYASTSA